MASRRLLALIVTAASAMGVSYSQPSESRHNPADTVAAPLPIANSALRQIIPTPQTRGGFINMDWLVHHERNVAEAKAGSYNLVFVGDSITDNFHKAGPAPDQVFQPIWNDLFAPHGALNLGVSGDSTQHVLWRLQNGELDGLSPSNIVLMIGTNNTWHDAKATAEDVAAGIEAVVTCLHTRVPTAKILVLAILPSTVSASKTEKDEVINTAVAKFYVDSGYVRTLDLKSLFVKNGVLDTKLFYDTRLPHPSRASVHPNTIGQRMWAEAVVKALYGTSERETAPSQAPKMQNAIAFYVSPEGSDENPGTDSRPFATLTRARQAVRNCRATGRTFDITVWLHGGLYLLNESFKLSQEDSGATGAPTVYRAVAGETPRIFGGVRLLANSFSFVEDPEMLRALAPEARGHVVQAKVSAVEAHTRSLPDYFRGSGGLFRLLMDDTLMPLSRWSNNGYTTMEFVLDSGITPPAGGTFVYREEAAAHAKRWEQAVAERRLWLTGFWRVPFEVTSLRVARMDTDHRAITFAAPNPNGIGSKYVEMVNGTRHGNGKEPYYAVNLMEEIDRPGEWSYDFNTAKQSGNDPGPRPIPSRPEPRNPDPTDIPRGGYRPGSPTVCWNAMYAPLLPFAARGVLWYQGEANVSQYKEYGLLLRSMVIDWRRQFGDADLNFLVVQLPANGVNDSRSNLAHMREAQSTVLQLPHTGLAITFDVGDPGNVHPASKVDIAHRLTLVAMAETYGRKIPYTGPVFQSTKVEGDALRVSFSHVAGKLVIAQSPWLSVHTAPFPLDQLIGFEIAGRDKQFVPATAIIESRDEVLLKSQSVPHPQYVRYAFENSPRANLYDEAHLRAARFAMISTNSLSRLIRRTREIHESILRCCDDLLVCHLLVCEGCPSPAAVSREPNLPVHVHGDAI